MSRRGGTRSARRPGDRGHPPDGSDRQGASPQPVSGTSASAYTVKYCAGTTDITAKVVAGKYKTASLAAAETTLITAKVTIKTTAEAGSKVTRLVTITSVGSSTKRDAVKFIGKRS